MSGRFSLGRSRKPQGHVMRFNFPINTEDNLQRATMEWFTLGQRLATWSDDGGDFEVVRRLKVP